jgi:primary-amine oxidase
VEAPKPNPFKALSGEEIASVVSWLMADKALNLTNVDSETLSLSDNYIAHIEALKPNKTDVVSYLDCNGTVPRYARIVLNQGAHDPPTVSEYFVSSSLFPHGRYQN